jgi:hypothetical protein
MLKDIGRVSLKCPCCGFINEIHVDTEELGKMNVFHCMVDEGGCDEPFVWRPYATIEAEVYAIAKLEKVQS